MAFLFGELNQIAAKQPAGQAGTFPLSAFRIFFHPLAVQPAKLETLDDLLAQAAHYAGFCMRNSGKMSPTLFLIGADGPVMFVPASLVDADEKDAFATTARLVCIAHAATVSVMALEAWMKNLADRFRMSGPCRPTVQHGLCHSTPRRRPVLRRLFRRPRLTFAPEIVFTSALPLVSPARTTIALAE
jgi:hypothetical protein